MTKRMILILAVASLALTFAGGHLLAQAPAAEGAAQQHSAAGAAHAEEQPGLIPDPGNPQTWLSALWVVIIFVAMLIVLYPTAWKQVLAGLKAREQRIRNDIAEAEAARAKAEATLREYSSQLAAAEARVREMLSKATADGEKLATGIRLKAQQESEEIKERAQKDIEAARDAALREIYERTAELATSVAEKIIRRNLNAADQQDLVRRSLEQLQEVK